MKHNVKITAIILGMFLLTQFIGLYVVNYYSPFMIVDGKVVEKTAPPLPFGMQPPEVKQQNEYVQVFISIIFAFIIAILLIFILTKYNVDFFIRAWFFIVVTIALGIALNSFIPSIPYSLSIDNLGNFSFTIIVASLLAAILSFLKIYKKNLYVHNITELIIYPGIAAVFVPLLTLWSIILLLIIISIYDMWAVWHSGFMQKMAKYQINKLNLFSGFFVPYASKKVNEKIRLIKQKSKSRKHAQKEFKKQKLRVNVAILGGGDVIFPIITSGVMLKTAGFGIEGALFVTVGATLGLTYLFLNSEKKKFYPAMPFISAGIFLAMLLAWILL